MNLQGPDIPSLRCFVAVAQQGSFRAASKSLALSPPALSERIRLLEEVLSTKLFTRTTRSVSLTEAGYRLLPHAEATLAMSLQCQEVVACDLTSVAWEVRLGTRYELGMDWLVPALKLLEQKEPKRKIHLVFSNSSELLEKLKSQEVDAVITSYRLGVGDWSAQPLHEEEYSFVASSDYARTSSVSEPRDAAHHRLLDVDASLPLFRYFLDAQPEQERWNFGEHQFLGTIGAIRARVLQGAGVAVLPTYLIAGDLVAERLIRLMPERTIGSDFFRFICLHKHPRVRLLKKMADELSAIPLPG